MGISLAVVGVLVASVQAGLIRVITPSIGNIKSIYIGFLLYAAGMFLVCDCQPKLDDVCISDPVLPGWYCRAGLAGHHVGHVPPNAQGELQGALTSLMSLTAIIGPLLMTNLFAYFTSVQAPLSISGCTISFGRVC